LRRAIRYSKRPRRGAVTCELVKCALNRNAQCSRNETVMSSIRVNHESGNGPFN
jgi:hypothetical protein